MSRATSIASLVILAAAYGVSGSGFLKTHGTSSDSRISREEVQVSLLDEIESSLGSGTAAKKIHQLEAQLAPMYAALPKNEHGGLSPPVVRYALHRLFVLRHGWFVKGLDRAGGSFNDSSPAGMLKDQVPGYIQGLFEKRLHGKGLGLHELAVFAATIEHLIHNEAVGRLGDALKVHDILPTSPLTEAEADGVLDTYIMAYILGENLTNMTLDAAKELHAEMPELYLAWDETKEFMRGMRQNISASTGTHEINFATIVKVAETAGEHFGSFQDTECKQLKRSLVAMEHKGSGRVKLSDFYKPALNGAWQFQESVSYLRESGLLDETDASSPKVIIPNYLLSPSNCIASSSYYSVCCMDECEALLAHIEEGVAAPEAVPSRISSLVANLASSSVSAPQELSDVQMQRLNDIAAAHHGTVPIHGRLFAQWMHHAFPRECPYPHVSGSTKPQTADEWMMEKGLEPTATVGEMLKYTSLSKQTKAAEASEIETVDMPWSLEEELLVVRPSVPAATAAQSSGWISFRSFMLVLAVGSVGLALVRTLKSTSAAVYEGREKQLV